MELREAALGLQEENLALRKQVRELEMEINRRKAVRFEKKAYFAEGDPVPFCPTCYEVDNLLVHLSGGAEYPYCTHCGIHFYRVPQTGEIVWLSGGPGKQKSKSK